MGQSLVDWFLIEGYRVAWWRNGRDALAGLRQAPPDLVLCDIRLPDMTGEDILRDMSASMGRTPFVFITGFGDIAQAVRLMQAGAADYLTKPFEIESLIARVEALLGSRWSLSEGYSLGHSPAIIEVEQVLRRVAPTDSTVLLRGPSGSGKEVAARLLHANGTRTELPFIAVNCAAIPKDLLESELFGHEKGSFTGAQQRHEGLAERVGGGTLFLDEVTELPPELQAKFLRLIEERSFRRIGGSRSIPFRARVIAATNADVEDRVRKALFREDLYFRLAVIVVAMPALRERREDILPLARRFVQEFAEKVGRNVRGIAPLAEEEMLGHAWPGNIRELRNRVERAVVLCDRDWLATSDLFPDRYSKPPVDITGRSLADARNATEKRMIEAALEAAGGDVERAASVLKVSRSTLFAKIRRLGVRS